MKKLNFNLDLWNDSFQGPQLILFPVSMTISPYEKHHPGPQFYRCTEISRVFEQQLKNEARNDALFASTPPTNAAI